MTAKLDVVIPVVGAGLVAVEWVGSAAGDVPEASACGAFVARSNVARLIAACWCRRFTDMRLTPDTHFANGKYRIIRHLGAGSEGDVYLVHHRTLGQQGMKVLARSEAGGAGAPYSDVRQRFALEARLGARLRHPNLLEIFDYDEVDGVAYLTMQYAESGTLADRIREGTPSIEQCVRWLLDAANGLMHLHDAAVIHRDVKPSNLLLLKDGRVVVADLGIAQTADDDSRRAGAGLATRPHPGSPDYMSPEHSAPSPLQPTSDVYSLGCVAFELLTGKRYAHVQSRVTGPAQLRPDVPQWLDGLVRRMLAPQPALRTPDAADLKKRYVGMAPVIEILRAGLQKLQREQRVRNKLRKLTEFARSRAVRNFGAGVISGSVLTLMIIGALAEIGGFSADQNAGSAPSATSVVLVSTAPAETTTPPTPPTLMPTKKASDLLLSAGDRHTCVLTNSTAVKCWGYNNNGELGDGTFESRSTPVQVSRLSGVIALSAGATHTCALTNDGSVACWGNNDYGMLGDGSKQDRSTPVRVSGLSGVSAISSGATRTCALTNDGSVACWGNNDYGQLSRGSQIDRWRPAPVAGLSDVIAISSGAYHVCALMSAGAVKCWGRNFFGQLGNGDATDRDRPVTVDGLVGVIAISAGVYHTCALKKGGEVACWGRNDVGQLGDGTTNESATPVTVKGLSSATALTLGREHTCALTRAGEVACWGATRIELQGKESALVTVPGLTGVTALSAGEFHTCAVVNDDEVRCWGENASRQLGDGTTAERGMPVTVSGL
jgi:alpha-tubulin suppressor-like RCC1 family protein